MLFICLQRTPRSPRHGMTILWRSARQWERGWVLCDLASGAEGCETPSLTCDRPVRGASRLRKGAPVRKNLRSAWRHVRGHPAAQGSVPRERCLRISALLIMMPGYVLRSKTIRRWMFRIRSHYSLSLAAQVRHRPSQMVTLSPKTLDEPCPPPPLSSLLGSTFWSALGRNS